MLDFLRYLENFSIQILFQSKTKLISYVRYYIIKADA